MRLTERGWAVLMLTCVTVGMLTAGWVLTYGPA